MGFFRRLKLSRFCIKECKSGCRLVLKEMSETTDLTKLEELADEWAVWRELQARHEGENDSDVA